MSRQGRSLGPLHPGAAEAGAAERERLAETGLDKAAQIELYRFMKLTRMLEDRLGILYRQGKVVGGLYSSRGQEATAVGSAYALGPGDFIAHPAGSAPHSMTPTSELEYLMGGMIDVTDVVTYPDAGVRRSRGKVEPIR